MADFKLPSRVEITSAADDDLLHVIDVSDTTASAEGTSKKIQKSNLIPTSNKGIVNTSNVFGLGSGELITFIWDALASVSNTNGANFTFNDLQIILEKLSTTSGNGSKVDLQETLLTLEQGLHSITIDKTKGIVFNISGEPPTANDIVYVKSIFGNEAILGYRKENTEAIQEELDALENLYNLKYTTDEYRERASEDSNFQSVPAKSLVAFTLRLAELNGLESLALFPSGSYNSTLVGVEFPNIASGTDGDFTNARASNKTFVNQYDIVETIGDNVTAIEYDVADPFVLAEPQSTNLYLNSDVFVTQGITTLASDYTVSFYGTGTITFTGTFSGSLVGTGENERVSLTFTATAGTLTSTLSGVATNSQAENLDFATSWILTAGTSVVRLQDDITGAGSTTTINSAEGVLFLEFKPLTSPTFQEVAISLHDTNDIAADRLLIRLKTDGNIGAIARVNNVNEADMNVSIDQSVFNKVAFKWAENDFALWINGVEVATDLSGNVWGANSLDEMQFDAGNNSTFFYGKVKQLKVFKVALTDQQLQDLTT